MSIRVRVKMGSPAYVVVTAVIVHHGIFVDDLVADFLPFAHFGRLVDPKVLTEIQATGSRVCTKALPSRNFFYAGKTAAAKPLAEYFSSLDATNFPVFFFGIIYLVSQSQWLLMARRSATRSMYRRKPLTRSLSSTLGRLIPTSCCAAMTHGRFKISILPPHHTPAARIECLF